MASDAGRSEYMRLWRLRNRERIKQYQREYFPKWYLKNKERKRDYDRSRMNRTDIRKKAYEASQRWGSRNRDRRRSYYRKWSKNNPAITAANNAKRRQRILATIDRAAQLQIRKVYARAAELRQWFNVVVDHIIPLAAGGQHLPSNLQIIYRTENEKKYAKLAYKPRVIFK